MAKERISDGIKKAHDRVARDYGIKGVEGFARACSYDLWNFTSNVEKPLSAIVKNYLSLQHILDAGCGNGQIAEVMLNAGAGRVTGIDFSENMLLTGLSRMHKTDHSDRFSVIRGDLSNLEILRPDSIDGALMFGVLEHLDEPETVIKGIMKAVKPGGVFVLGVPRKHSLSYFSYVLFGESPKRWGKTRPFIQRLVQRFNWREKLNYYRFYSPGTVRTWFSGVTTSELTERIPIAFNHMDGVPGLLLRILGRNARLGHRLLSLTNKIIGKTGLPPAGEYWIYRKQ